MDMKTYQGNSMAEALATVKRDLGREAVILHTRTLKRGGMLGVGGKTLVEITATRDVNVLHPAERRAIIARQTTPKPRSSPAVAGKSGPSSEPPTQVGGRIAEDLSSLSSSIRNEMGELRNMVRELLARPQNSEVQPSAPDVPDELRAYYTRLVQNAVAEEIATDVIAKAK